MKDSQYGPMVPTLGVAIAAAALGLGLGVGPYTLPFLALALWCYLWFRQMGDSEPNPRNDQPEEYPVVTMPRYTTLAVVSMKLADSEPVDVVLWVPAMKDFSGFVLSPEHILGHLTKKLADGGMLEPANFVEHEFFVSFLHQFLGRELPGRPHLQEESRRKQEGWVVCVDERVLDFPAPAPGSGPDEEDIIGRVRVREGAIEPESYERNPGHRLLTDKGPFKLDFVLTGRLIQEIKAHHAFRQAGDVITERVM